MEGRWVIACGVHDRWTELHALDHADLERRLTRVGMPPWWSDRPGTLDNEIANYVVHHDEYRLGNLRLAPADAVIDIGAHVGSFAFAAWSRGSRNVHCYEPDAANLTHLRSNAAHMPGVTVWPEAVSDRAGTLYARPPAVHAENTGAAWCSPDPPGVPVPAVPLDLAIGRAGGKVALLKIDAEGGEFAALAGCTRLADVGRVVLEFHADPAPLVGKLRAAGFAVEVAASGDNPLMGLLFARR